MNVIRNLFLLNSIDLVLVFIIMTSTIMKIKKICTLESNIKVKSRSSLPVDDHSAGKVPIELVVLPQRLADGRTHVVVELLGGVGVQGRHAEVLAHAGVEAGHHSPHGPALLDGVVVGVVAYHHGVSQRHPHCPGFSPELGVHLDGDLGGHRHQTLGLAQHSRSDNLKKCFKLELERFKNRCAPSNLCIRQNIFH